MQQSCSFNERMRARTLRHIHMTRREYTIYIQTHIRGVLMTCWKKCQHTHNECTQQHDRVWSCMRVYCLYMCQTSTARTNPYECRNIKAFPSDNVSWILAMCCIWCGDSMVGNKLHRIAKATNEKNIEFDVLFCFFFPFSYSKNAVTYADELKWNASNIIFELINM